MSTKRKHEDEGEEDIHPSRKSHIQSQPKGVHKRPRQADNGPVMHKQAHASSVNAIKKNIRNVTRRLQRSEDLPANVKAEDERALTAYQQELRAAEDEKVRQAMIKKYHMVRFFERQKATRLIKRTRKALLTATESEEVDRLTNELHIADVDYNYTQYSPLNEIYVSIYKQEDSSDDGVEIKKPETWYEVEKRMEEGGLDDLRNGIRETTATPKPKRSLRISGANGEARLERRPKSGNDTQPSTSRTEANRNYATHAKAEPTAKPMSRRMTDDEFFKLNRRQKRAELKKSGGFVPAKQATKPEKKEEDDGHISDGGFFE